jgi:hypothetical protein
MALWRRVGTVLLMLLGHPAAMGQGRSPAPAEVLPFLDLASGNRFGGAPVRPWCPEGYDRSCVRRTVGLGLPLVLAWPLRPGVAGELLTYREGTRWVRREVTGLDQVVLRPSDRITACALEALDRSGREPGAYLSHFREFSIGVRGLMLLAGDPAVPGHGDGQGAAARFQQPFGLAMTGCGRFCSRQYLVADRAAHVVRTVSAEGEVATPWGSPFEAGYRDGLGCARFNGPTFLAGNRHGRQGGPWEPFAGFVLADSGNQVIRSVDPQGMVTTLAGTPGQAGCRDADDPRQALFNDPRGLAMDRAGNVYVADRGNHLIRRIARDGPVTTLAGAPGLSGWVDGCGGQARFSALEGLALHWDETLYVADGHGVRRVTLDGRVTTLLGAPDRPGFGLDREAGPGVPCLRAPCGLVAEGEHLTIADQGNRAVRQLHLGTGALVTLAGDPALGGSWGLLRDGIPGPLGEAYAGLAEPRGITVDDQGEFCVATGPCLARLCRERLTADGEPARLTLAGPVAGLGAPFAVEAALPASEAGPMVYTLQWIHPDGSLAARLQGRAAGGQVVGGAGCFTQPGRGRVVLQWVTAQGVSRGVQESVLIE